MIIRKFNIKDSEEVYRLVFEVFSKFFALSFTKRAANKWLAEQIPEKQVKRAKTRDVFVSIINGEIVGMIEAKMEKGKKGNRISRLFVDKKYHKRGVGKALVGKIEKLYKKRGVKKIIINSSPYAVGFYVKVGYKKNGKIIKKEGMAYQPMIKILPDQVNHG